MEKVGVVEKGNGGGTEKEIDLVNHAPYMQSFGRNNRTVDGFETRE